MKIYHKKLFASGVFMAVLGMLNVIGCVVTQEVDAKSIGLISLMFLFGVAEIRKSLFDQRSKEQWREERDERNQLVVLKSKSKAFQVMQGILFVGMVPLLIVGAWQQNQAFIGIGFGMAAIYTLSMFVELITFIYYEGRN